MNDDKHVDFAALKYYDQRNKQYIDTKIDELKTEFNDTERRVDTLEATAKGHDEQLKAHREELDDLEGRVINLERDDISIRKDIADLRLAVENGGGGSGSGVSKDYVDNKIEEAIESLNIPDTSDFVTKSDFADASEDFVTDSEITELTDTVAGNQVAIEYLQENKANKSDLENFATKEYLEDKISEITIPESELYTVDYTAPDFAAALEAYNKGKLLLLTNAAPDGNGYAIMNYVRDDMITFTKFLTSRSETYGSFNTYYLHSDNTWEVSKEVKLNKVEGNVTEEATSELKKIKIGNTVYYLPDTSSFVTTKQFTVLQEQLEKIDDTYVSEEYLEAYYVTNTALEEKNYITEQFVSNNYVTNETIEANYSTKEEIAETYVTNNEVNQKIENKVTEVIEQKMEDGNIVVNADSINYDTWDEEGW